MTSTTPPRHPAAESDAPGFFQPFTDLRPTALRTANGGESVAHPAHVYDPGTVHSIHPNPWAGEHTHSVNDPGHAHGIPALRPGDRVYIGQGEWGAAGHVGERFPEAANEPAHPVTRDGRVLRDGFGVDPFAAHHCAGTLSPECMSDAEFVAAMEAARANWNDAIDALLDAHAPGWREERDRQQAAAGQIASVAA